MYFLLNRPWKLLFEKNASLADGVSVIERYRLGIGIAMAFVKGHVEQYAASTKEFSVQRQYFLYQECDPQTAEQKHKGHKRVEAKGGFSLKAQHGYGEKAEDHYGEASFRSVVEVRQGLFPPRLYARPCPFSDVVPAYPDPLQSLSDENTDAGNQHENHPGPKHYGRYRIDHMSR